MSVQERVARGARWLDGASPGWRDAMALRSLNLSSGESCLLGQVFAQAAGADERPYGSGYEYALARVVTPAERLAWPDWPSAHGFDCPVFPTDDECEDMEPVLGTMDEARRGLLALQAEWRRMIHVPRDELACGVVR